MRASRPRAAVDVLPADGEATHAGRVGDSQVVVRPALTVADSLAGAVFDPAELLDVDAHEARPQRADAQSSSGWLRARGRAALRYPRTQSAQIAHGPRPLRPVFAHSPSRVPHLKQASSCLATYSATASCRSIAAVRVSRGVGAGFGFALSQSSLGTVKRLLGTVRPASSCFVTSTSRGDVDGFGRAAPTAETAEESCARQRLREYEYRPPCDPPCDPSHMISD